MTGEAMPIYCGSTKATKNYCGMCGTDATRGVWRRGWSLNPAGDKHVNLCNACGLKFKGGKTKRIAKQRSVHKSNTEAQTSAKKKPGNASKKSVNARNPPSPPPPPQQEKRKEKQEKKPEKNEKTVKKPGNKRGGKTLPFVSYTLERRPQPDKPEHLSAYFYVQDAKGKSKLAVIGTNTGSYHFVYVSQDLGKGIPSLRCTNRSKVVEWLNSIGATEQIDESGETVPDGCRPLEKKAKIEKTSKTDARKGTGERAGKAEEVAKRGGAKNATKSVGVKRKASGGGGAQTSKASRRTRTGGAHDTQEAAGDSTETKALADFIDRQAKEEDVARFRIWAEKLDNTIMYNCDTTDPMCTTRKEIVKILLALEVHPICLSLLEAAPLPKRIAKLIRHENKKISALARKVKTDWMSTSKAALALAKQRKKHR